MDKKAKQDKGWCDNFLFISGDAITKYASYGGDVVVTVAENGINVLYVGIQADDPRLADSFKELLNNDGA